MTIVADHLLELKGSAVSRVTVRAKQLETEGRDIIPALCWRTGLGTPDHIKLAAIKAITEGKTQYPIIQGIPELREAICRKLKKDNELSYTPEEVIVSVGCKQVIFNAMVATLNPGDEVIVPTPYFVSYPSMIEINRGKPIFVSTRKEDHFKLTAEDLETAITPKTKWVFINNPGNPSGAVYTEQEFLALTEVFRRHPNVWILSDDIYEFMVFDEARFYSLLQIAPDLKERTLITNGVSKAYAMTGWRVGYGAGPEKLIKTMLKVQSQSTSGTCSISQWASVAALNSDQSCIEKYNEVLKKRRDLVVSIINNIEGLSCDSPKGAFYCYISCEDIIGKKTPNGDTIATDFDFSNFLMEECGVAVVHGEAFGLSPYFRISYATEIEKLKLACNKIAEACTLLR